MADATGKPVPHLKPTAPLDMTQGARFLNWRARFIDTAINKGYDPELIWQVMGRARLNPDVLVRNQTQPEFIRPVWDYLVAILSSERLAVGQAQLAERADLWADIESRYQVERHILAAIWGLESQYGQIMGDYEIINALASFAYEGRRQAFAQAQLWACLDLLTAEYVRVEQLRGSWAGAMGMVQFIPTSFLQYAVDFDTDGYKDLWHTPADALGSAANYLAQAGWQWQAPVYVEVRLADGFDYSLAFDGKKTVQTWAELGVYPYDGLPWADSMMDRDAALFLPAGYRGPKILTFRNFDAIKAYNNSNSYALAIGALARRFENQPAILQAWPENERPLSLTDKKVLQRHLRDLGYDIGRIDGRIGPKTRRAVWQWQKAHGFPADGYVTAILLGHMLARK